MSLLNVKSKFILYDILFQIPIKKRLEIINGSKKLYQKLEYFPITKELYDKLFNYLNNNIDSYCCQNYPIKSIFYTSLNDLAKKIQKKFPNKSNEFFELIKEIIIENIKAKNIYIIHYDDTFNSKFDLLNDDDYDSSGNIIVDFFSKYEELFKFNYYKYIIKFDIQFCEMLRNKSLKKNINKIYGINLNLYDLKHEIKRKLYMISEKIDEESWDYDGYFSDEDEDELYNIKQEEVFDLLLEYLDLLNQNFTNIYFLKLDFSNFFNNFNEKEFEKIFNCLSNFAKRNSIEILFFKDDTHRTDSFINNYKIFIKSFNNLNELYFYKNFMNSYSSYFLYEAFENKEEIVNYIEDPNLILYNYLTDVNKNIKILNVEISNPCSINGNPGYGSFYTLATLNEDFSLISNFKNLEEFTLYYDWPAEYYYEFEGNSLVEALNSLKNLKKVTFEVQEYLSKLIPLLNVKDAKFIS